VAIDRRKLKCSYLSLSTRHFVVSTVSATWTALDGMPAPTAWAVTWPASVGVVIKG